MSLVLSSMDEAGVVTLTLNAPETRNAILDLPMIEALLEAIKKTEADQSARVIVLTGTGSCFSSGGNIKKMGPGQGLMDEVPAITRQNYRNGIQRLPLAFEALDLPVVAAVNGPAVGAGCDLTLMCDVRIAGTSARFAENFVRIGIVPGDGGAWLLPRVVGFARACEMALTGDMIDAEEALAIGLVSRVVPDDELLEAATAVARRIAANPPHAVRMTRRLMRQAYNRDLEMTLELSSAMQALAHATDDYHQALEAIRARVFKKGRGVTAPEDEAPEALAGVRVLDLSRVLAGPWATQILADLGAEVTKIERPGRGDDTRAWGPPWAEAEGELQSGYYLACNRNKRSLALDIARPEGAALVRRLAAESDVLVENFKTGDLARYGLDYESLRGLNPGLIYCSITGFGQSGPYAGRGGYDFLLQAMGGLMSVTGPDAESPTKVGVAVVDLFTGLYATIAIQAALRHRDRTGEGQAIDCALLDSAVGILANQAMNWLVGGTLPQPMGNAHPNVVPYRNFEAADGHLIVAVGNDGQFRALCLLLERPDLAEDARFASSALRLANRVVLEAELEAEIAGRESAALLAAMAGAGVPGGPINRLDAVFADPQVLARGMVEQVLRPGGTAVPQVRFPPRLSRSPARIRRAPPRLGADGREVLEQLGLAEAEIDRLHAEGVLSLPE